MNPPQNKAPLYDRIEASLIAGACGDALGAPYDFLKLPAILERTGPRGITAMVLYDPAVPELAKFGPGERKGTGLITDDTAMTAAVLAGFLAAAKQGPVTRERALPAIHYALLRWGKHQPWRNPDVDMDAMGNAQTILPRWFDAFCYRTGAGWTTVAALETGTIGTPETPLLVPKHETPDVLIANDGCGGMIRTAPVGWLAALGALGDAYNWGVRVAAITHGGTNAQAASGALAFLNERLLRGDPWKNALEHTLQRLAHEPKAADVLSIMERAAALGHARAQTLDFETVCALPVTLGAARAGKNRDLFLSAAILGQAIAIAASVQHLPARDALARGVTLAVTQSGDSDSTGAIVGNLLGSQFGTTALPPAWTKKLADIATLRAMARQVRDTPFSPPRPVAAGPKPVC